MAIYAWTTCFVVTIVISLLTERKKSDDELRGLVYSLTDRFAGDDHLRLVCQTGGAGRRHAAVTIVLNITSGKNLQKQSIGPAGVAPALRKRAGRPRSGERPCLTSEFPSA